MARILIIDDHRLFRDGLKMILNQNRPGDALAEAGSVMEAIDMTRGERFQAPDLILMDIQMPGLNGLDGIQLVIDRFPSCPVIMLSASNDEQDRRTAINRGARGFLNKSTSADEILDVVGGALSGEMPPCERSKPQVAGGSALTSRQLEVLALLCEGKSNKLIARSLGVSENTVRGHVSAILSYFNASSRTEVTVIAQRQKLVSPGQ